MIWKTQQGLLGIDFGSNAIKVAQTRKVHGRITLEDATCAISDHVAPLDISIERLPEVHWRAFRFACNSSAEFQNRNAACLLPKSCASLQFIQVGDGRPVEQRKMIETWLESNSSGSEGLTWDFWNWSNDDGVGSEENAGIILTSRLLAESTESTLRSSGVYCRAMDGVPTALSRAVGMQSHEAGPVVALDWGVSEALLTVIVDGAPVFARNLRGCGLGDALSQCGETLCLTEKEINAIWRGDTFDFLNASQQVELRNAVTDFFSEAVNVAVEELRRTIDYLNSHRQIWRPLEIMLFGLGSLIPNVSGAIGKATSLATSVWSPNTIVDSRVEPEVPISLLGPAIAMSTLVWES